MRFFTFSVALLIACLRLHAAANNPPAVEKRPTDLITDRHVNGFKWEPLVPGRDDGRIAIAAAKVIEHFHYAQQSLDDDVSAKFLDKYLDALDPGHLVFLQSDLAEFEKWRTKLDDLTFKGDTSPAEIIFNRFLQRFAEQVEYVTNLIATEHFEFKGPDRYPKDRKDLPRPADLAGAKQLWRDRVRFEWLTELLNAPPPTNAAAKSSSSKASAKTADIRDTLVRRYTRTLRTLQEFDSDDVVQYYLSSLTRVYDPHSEYMGKATFDNFNIQMRLSLFGIGALLTSEDGYCKIKELMEGPAKKSGKVKPNDKIIAVAQGTNDPVDVVDMKLSKVVDLIRGPKDTEVRLTIIPVEAPDASTRKVVTLVRDEIKLEDGEAKAKVIELPVEAGRAPLRFGVIDLPSFYGEMNNRKPDRKSTTTDVAKLLKKLKEENISGVILDLRRNGGGLLEEAVNLTGLFIKEGPVVQVRDPDGHVHVDRDSDSSVLYDGPLVVLTSRFSASASEILAGALQDYGRALIVGDSSTHGKGTVQSVLHLSQFLKATNDLGTIKITIRKFYRASGSSTQLKGVVPDIVLPSLNNHAEVGEASLPNALPWDTVDSAKYQPVNLIPPLLPELRRRSEARVANDKDFTFVRDEIERFKKAREEKTLSLNEEERWKEKKENEARAEARKKELRSRPQPDYKTYELSLKSVNVPGLPAPVAKTNSAKIGETNASRTAKVPPLTNVIAKASEAEEDEAKEDSDVPTPDITLEEGWRILRDLIQLSKNGSLTGPLTVGSPK